MDKIYNIGFLFKDDSFNGFVKELSQIYGKKFNSNYILGVNSFPHITLLQVVGDKSEIYNILKENNFLNIKINFSLSCFYCNISEKETCYEIRVELSKELIELQDKIYNALGKPEIKNKLGNRFNPHITLGCIKPESGIKLILEENISFNSIDGYLSFGVSGENYQFEKEIVKG